MLGAASLLELRAKSAAEIQKGLTGPRPIIDGWYLSEDVLEQDLPPGRHQEIDLLIGSNKDEGTFPFLRAPRGLGEMTAVQFTAYAHERFGTNADAFLRLYPAGSDGEVAAAHSRRSATRRPGTRILGGDPAASRQDESVSVSIRARAPGRARPAESPRDARGRDSVRVQHSRPALDGG